MKQFAFLMLMSVLPLFACAQKGITKYTLTNGDSKPRDYLLHNGKLFFTLMPDASFRSELWEFDGITQPRNIGKGYDGSPFPYHFIVGAIGDSLLIAFPNSANLPSGSGIYTYNLKTDSLILFYSGKWTGNLMKSNNYIFFTTVYQTSNRICRLDTTTMKIDTFLNCPPNTGGLWLAHINNNYYLAQGNNSINPEVKLYKVDTISKTYTTPISNVHREKLIVIDNDIYFPAFESYYGIELHKYDVITGQVRRVTDLNPGAGGCFDEYHTFITKYNGRIYFMGSTKSNIMSLFEYDPATSTSRLVYSNKQPERDFFYPKNFYVYNKRLYMTGTIKGTRHQLCVYDGADTPYVVAHLQPEYAKDNDIECYFQEMKGDLYFTFTDSLGNREMFRFNDSLLRPIPPPSPQGLNPISYAITATLYPNPTAKNTYIDVQLNDARTIEVQVTDINGSVVCKVNPQLYSTGKHTIHLQTTQLPSGTYIYTIADGENGLLQSGKFIKQ